MSLFVRVVTHFGSNESNDSLGVFSVQSVISFWGERGAKFLSGVVPRPPGYATAISLNEKETP